MRILAYSAMNADTVQQNFGEPEYSYYFVLREFMPLLQQVGQVQVVEDPASEVDPLYHAARARGEDCVFLSFSPPHLTRSEEHTSELQSRPHLVCRLLLEKKKRA